jgi:hypothetical protein
MVAENAAFHAVVDQMADSSPDSGPFGIWRGEQWAIGEIATTSDRNGLPCSIGYAKFREKWGDPTFRKWFENMEDDIRNHMHNKPCGQVDRLRKILAALRNLWRQLAPKDTDTLLLSYATSPGTPDFLKATEKRNR